MDTTALKPEVNSEANEKEHRDALQQALDNTIQAVFALLDIGRCFRTEEAPPLTRLTMRACIEALADQVIDGLQNDVPQVGKSWGYVTDAQTNLGEIKSLARFLRDDDSEPDSLCGLGAGIERLAQIAARNINAAGRAGGLSTIEFEIGLKDLDLNEQKAA
jgi:hypothetical protein